MIHAKSFVLPFFGGFGYSDSTPKRIDSSLCPVISCGNTGTVPDLVISPLWISRILRQWSGNKAAFLLLMKLMVAT